MPKLKVSTATSPLSHLHGADRTASSLTFESHRLS